MRTIILMPDWNSTLFWRDTEGHGHIDEEALPISDSLKHRLECYYKHFSELYFEASDQPIIPDVEKRLLDDTGLEIWQMLRKELTGFYRVLFYSAEFGDSFENPEEFVAVRKQTDA
jgi:hypothetical protein